MKYTIDQFRKEFSNDAVCLDKLFILRFGKLEACPECGVVDPKFTRITSRRCYQCKDCYHQIYPTAGTILEKTTTPLNYWFYAMYLMTVTRNGVSAKELERTLGVTYKTAWRMARMIRVLMGRGAKSLLHGIVECDETLIGGTKEKTNMRGRSMIDKSSVFAMVERNGSVIAMQVDNNQKATLFPIIDTHIDKKAVVMTDEFKTYVNLKDLGYQHETIMHQLKQWKVGRISTNTVEGYFSQLKRMIGGTHIWVSKKHLQHYINESCFRYNNRHLKGAMFDVLVKAMA